jgi:alkylation response protein AidB-like acyl-CoA dehydrogenase
LIDVELKNVLPKVHEIVQEVILPRTDEVDEQAKWPQAQLRALQQAGLGGLVVPQAYGGLGYGLLGLAQVCEVLGQACPSTSLCFGMHCVGSAVISAKVTSTQQAQYLDPINQGKHLTTLALSEPGTGSHFYLPNTQLTKTNDNFKIDGVKTFVTNGGYADSYVISTVAAEHNAPPGMFSCVIIPADVDGIHWGDIWNGLGMRGNSSRSMELKNVLIPAQNLLGEEGEEIWYIFNVVAPYFIMAMAGTYLGIASGALEEARKHLLRRAQTHTGTFLAKTPVLQHKLGELWAEVERTRQLIYSAGIAGDENSPNALPALLGAKAEVAGCVVNVVNEAMSISGGIAYRENSLLSRYLRDARAAHIMAPTTDVLYTWLGRYLLDLPLLGD